jgi:hypothetical protein
VLYLGFFGFWRVRFLGDMVKSDNHGMYYHFVNFHNKDTIVVLVIHFLIQFNKIVSQILQQIVRYLKN